MNEARIDCFAGAWKKPVAVRASRVIPIDFEFARKMFNALVTIARIAEGSSLSPSFVLGRLRRSGSVTCLGNTVRFDFVDLSP